MGGEGDGERGRKREKEKFDHKKFKSFYMIYCSRLLFTVIVEALVYACGVMFIGVDNEISKVYFIVHTDNHYATHISKRISELCLVSK